LPKPLTYLVVAYLSNGKGLNWYWSVLVGERKSDEVAEERVLLLADRLDSIQANSHSSSHAVTLRASASVVW